MPETMIVKHTIGLHAGQVREVRKDVAENALASGTAVAVTERERVLYLHGAYGTALPEGFDAEEPPAASPEPGAPAEASADDLTELDGVGKSRAAKLADAGFDTFAKLAEADPDEISSLVGGFFQTGSAIVAAARAKLEG